MAGRWYQLKCRNWRLRLYARPPSCILRQDLDPPLPPHHSKPASSARPNLTLLTLPIEIRNIIYKHLLISQLQPTPSMHPQILATCQQCLNEGIIFLYGTNNFDLFRMISNKLFFEHIGRRNTAMIRSLASTIMLLLRQPHIFVLLEAFTTWLSGVRELQLHVHLLADYTYSRKRDLSLHRKTHAKEIYSQCLHFAHEVIQRHPLLRRVVSRHITESMEYVCLVVVTDYYRLKDIVSQPRSFYLSTTAKTERCV
jgi:hypothetical protein